MAKDDMTYFKMMFENICKGQENMNNKLDTANEQLARQDEHLKNLNSKIATQEIYNATTNARFTDVYQEFQKSKDNFVALDKKIMNQNFNTEKGYMKIEFKIAIISAAIYILVTFGQDAAKGLLVFFGII